MAYSQGKGGLYETISTQKAAELIANHRDDSEFIILDVRTPGEFNDGHLPNAVLLDFYSESFIEKLERLKKTKTYLIYCHGGNRSGKTLDLIKTLGFEAVYNMGLGIKGWRSKRFPIVK